MIFQSGVSEDGRNLAAHVAEGIYARPRPSRRGRPITPTSSGARALGRDPEHVFIFIGAKPVVAHTRGGPRASREIFEEDNDFDRKLGSSAGPSAPTTSASTTWTRRSPTSRT